jgi:predicted transglutaminase-like cysteine proteinase
LFIRDRLEIQHFRGTCLFDTTEQTSLKNQDWLITHQNKEEHFKLIIQIINRYFTSFISIKKMLLPYSRYSTKLFLGASTMFIRRVLPAIAVLSIAALQVSDAQAFPGQGISRSAFIPMASRMQERGQTTAPYAHVDFCTRNPGQCRGKGSASGAHLSRGSWRMLQQVNLKINRSIRPTSDRRRGKADHWTITRNQGDCEDYALTKRSELIKRGWSPSSVLMATVRDRKNRPHAVLVAHTNRGDFVLDSQTGKIKPWNKTGYKWLKRQSRSNPRKWVSLSKGGGVVKPRTTRLRVKAPKSGRARNAYLLAALRKARGGSLPRTTQGLKRTRVALPAHVKKQIARKHTRKRIAYRTVSKRQKARTWTKKRVRKTVRSYSRKRYTKRSRKHLRKRWVRRAFGGSILSFRG